MTLVGASLWDNKRLQQHDGAYAFPRYCDGQTCNANSASAALNKWMKTIYYFIEAALIDDPDKNVYYMWGQIKRRCLKGDTIAWPHATAVKHGRCSKSQVTGIMNKLMKLGAITRPQEGKRGANSGRAAIYRREF